MNGTRKQHWPFDMGRKVIAFSTSLGWKAPHGAYVYEADATLLLEEFQALNNGKEDAGKLALNTVLLKVIVESIKAEPRLNGYVSFNQWLCSGHIKITDRIDVNTPVLLSNDEMITVKIPDCGGKSLAEIQRHIDGLMNKLENARADMSLLKVGLEDTFEQVKRGDFFHPLGRFLGLKLGRDRVKGFPGREKGVKGGEGLGLCNEDINLGTVTISNLGAAVRNTAGTPVLIDLISPQVLAVGIGAVQEKPVIIEGRVVPRRMIPFCVVFDHRAVDFGHVAKFIRKMECFFKCPRQLGMNSEE
jgi:pyruvate dehydrogenase E2 component (dihydrolipoamide acetyltransferase)